MNSKRSVLALITSACFCFMSQPAARAQAVTIYRNANIHTLSSPPRAEAIAVSGDSVWAVGTESHVRAVVRANGHEDAAEVDLGGATVLPGLIDAHGHMVGLGALGSGVIDLRGTTSYDAVIGMVKQRADELPPGAWVIGRGWDHESWPEKELPHHTRLSEAVPENPVWLARVDGHAGLANAAAMRAARIDEQTVSPQGGEMLRDEAGKPTGVFVDAAEELVGRAVPSTLRGSTEELILRAQAMCLEKGLTGVHDAGVSAREIEIYKRLEREGKLKIRVYAMIHGAEAEDYFREHGVYEGERLTVRSAKFYIDGAMGSRGAWLIEPYADRPTGPGGIAYTGLNVIDVSDIEAAARAGRELGYQVCVHAIGDRGNREVLDAIGRAFDGDVARMRAARFRIEHAQLLSPFDIPRFGGMGVIASMQPTHCTSDMRWVDARVGPERADGAYAWASLLKTGATLAFGSDFPVESHDPLLGIFAGVTRQNADMEPAGGWHADQRLTREECLRAFTTGAAFAGFMEDRIGTLRPGMKADFIALDRDLLTCEATDITGARVLLNVIDGKVVFDARR